MSFCLSYTIVKSDGEVMTAHPLRCRSWLCPNCHPWRRSLLVKEATAGKPSTFITLTSNPAMGASPDARATALVEAWRHIVRQLRRKPQYKKLQYLVVIEKTKNGEPHLHILARVPYISQKWLSAQMQQLVNAPIVDIRRVTGKSAVANYVAKYVGKNPATFANCKRYWRSMDYLHPTRRELREQRDPDIVDYFVNEPFADYCKRLKVTQWHIARETNIGLTVHAPPWEDAPPLCLRVKTGSWQS